MTVKKACAAGLVLCAVLGAAGVAAFHWMPLSPQSIAIARGQERPRTPVVPIVVHPNMAYLPAPRSSNMPAPRSRVARRVRSSYTTYSAPHRVRVSIPHLAGAVRQIGGREPAMRVVAPGAWINSSSLDVVVRMSSPTRSVRLQSQIELRRTDQPFTGRPTAMGPAVPFSGAAVLGAVHVRGLRDGVSYHWQVRVHDSLGTDSGWVDPFGGDVALRVSLMAPARPEVTLVTPSLSGGWVGTRWITVRWTAPADRSGIRGYAYTLSRSASATPVMRLRTSMTSVRVRARSGGRWYFTVRALNDAHSWGPPARIAVRVDTTVPRLRQVWVPTRAVNIRRSRRLADLRLMTAARVVVDVVSNRGRVVRSIPTHVHARGYHLAVFWDGTDTRGRIVPNGLYTVRVSAVTPAGIRWQTVRALRLVDVAPSFTAFGLAQTGTYNPYNDGIDGPEVITASLSAPATVHVEAVHGDRVLRAWDLRASQPGAVVSATWDGTDGTGAAQPGGLYTFRAVAVDAAGNRATMPLGWVVLDHRRIVVSLDAQRLWAMDGDRVLLTTLVTTGGPELPTPTGDYQIIDRESPFTFHSPYPTDSPYWYPDSPANFALLFQVNGYFIHDAPWRSYYGPGSNSIDGKPGSNTTGTHGCVNVPYYPMAWLFNWATMFTPVQVRQSVAPASGQ